MNFLMTLHTNTGRYSKEPLGISVSGNQFVVKIKNTQMYIKYLSNHIREQRSHLYGRNEGSEGFYSATFLNIVSTN